MKRKTNFRTPDQLLLPWSPSHTISTARAAEMLDVHPVTVWRMIEAGELKAYKIRPGASPWRVNYDSVMKRIEAIHRDNELEKRF